MIDFDAKLEALLAWIQEGSAKSHVSAKITVKNSPTSGRGLYATDLIRPKEEIVNIPHSLLLNFTTVVAHISKFAGFQLLEPYYSKISVPNTSSDEVTEIYKKLTLEGLLKLLSFQLIGLYLVFEKRRGKNSFWKPFLDMLPDLEELSLAPAVWTITTEPSHEELTKFMPRSTKKHTARVVDRFNDDFAAVTDFVGSDVQIDKIDFLWAWMCINSRCLYMEMPQKTDTSDFFTLAPYVDFLNHLGNDECGIKIDSLGFRVVTSSSYTAGNELFFSYGPHSNEFLLCEYGFTLPENRWNYIDISDYLMPLLRPQQAEFLKESGYYAEYTVNGLGASFRTEIALATLQEADPLQSRRLKAFVDGISDGAVYESKSQTLLRSLLNKILGDCQKKLSQDISDPKMEALAVIHNDAKQIIENTLKELS